jgi:pimeloyl-ACP methyl ester carboxylesterase
MKLIVRSIKFVAWSLLFLCLLATGAYGLVRFSQEELDQSARDRLGGNYLQTERGVLSYTRQGEADAPTLILVHGFSTPKFVWEQVTPGLLDAGYQVITYDHYGRGFSDRPTVPYDSDLYQSELSSLIEGLGLATPLTLVGYSMGGANVVDYTASNPQQIEQLVLIAPAGYMRGTGSASALVAPVIGEWLLTMFGKQLAYSGIEAEVESGRAPPGMLASFEEQAAYAGYTDSLLSTLRHFPMAEMGHRYRVVGETSIPVTAIWGTEDKIVPYSGAALMAEDVPQLELVTLEGSNHNITFGQADRVLATLLEALQ